MEAPVVKPLSAEHLSAAAAMLCHLNPRVPPETILSRLALILKEHPHYHLVGAFSGSALLGIAGAWVATKIWCGRYMEIDNLVVHPDYRSCGVGSLLIRHLEAEAREQGCSILSLDSYTSNHSSHRLYHRLGLEIWSFHFIKPLS